VAGSIAMLERGARLGKVADLRSVYDGLMEQGIRFDRKLLEQSLGRIRLAQLEGSIPATLWNARRLALHDDPQDTIDPRLIAFAVPLEPLEDIGVEPDGQLLFLRWPRGCGPFEKRFAESRNVRVVDSASFIASMCAKSLLIDLSFTAVSLSSSRGAWAATTMRPATRPSVTNRSSP
jgi:hypothetical protein